MKGILILLIVILAIYLIVAIVGFLLGFAFNGKFDQSKQPIKKIAIRSFRWPLSLVGR